MKHKQCKHLRNKLFFILFLFLVSFSFVSSLEFINNARNYYSKFLAYFGFGEFVFASSNIFGYSLLVGLFCYLYYQLIVFYRIFKNDKDRSYETAVSVDKMFYKTEGFKAPLEMGLSPYFVLNFFYGSIWKIFLTSFILTLFSEVPFLVFFTNTFQLLFLSTKFHFFWRVLFTSIIVIVVPKYIYTWFFYKRALGLSKNVKNIKKMKSLINSIEREAEMAKV